MLSIYKTFQNTYAPDPDPEMKIEEYERSYEQDDDLGLNDMNTENYLPSGKPLQFRPQSSHRGCCAKSQLLMDIGRSGRHLITRDTPGSTCQTSPNLQAMRKNSARSNSQKYPASPLITRTRSVTPEMGSKQWQFVSRLLLFAFLIIFMAAWSYMLCSMDNECRPFSNESSGNGTIF